MAASDRDRRVLVSPLSSSRRAGSQTAAGRLPTYLLIGATKAGTTSLHRYLTRHPDVFMHAHKEMRFFSNERQFARGTDWYREKFAAAADALAVGEASNEYTRLSGASPVPRRIANVVPGARLVYLVRDPLRRIESHYRHRLVTGWEWRDPETAVTQDPVYLNASLYGAQLRRYLEVFPRSQILVVRSEAVFADPDGHLSEICGFLGVQHDPSIAFERDNAAADRPIAPQMLRAINRMPFMRPLMHDVLRRLRRTSLFDGNPSAACVDFVLSPTTRDSLLTAIREDQRLLADLAGRAAVANYDVSDG